MKQEKKKRYTDWEEIILFLFAEGLILYMEYSKGSSKQNKNKNKQVNFARLQKKIKILIMNMQKLKLKTIYNCYTENEPLKNIHRICIQKLKDADERNKQGDIIIFMDWQPPHNKDLYILPKLIYRFMQFLSKYQQVFFFVSGSLF